MAKPSVKKVHSSKFIVQSKKAKKNSTNYELPTNNFLKIGPASKTLGVSIDTLRRWEKSGKIKTVRTPGGTRLYSLDQLAHLRGGTDLSAIARLGGVDKPLSTEELLRKVSEETSSVMPSVSKVERSFGLRPQDDIAKKAIFSLKTFSLLTGLALTITGGSLLIHSFLNHPATSGQRLATNPNVLAALTGPKFLELSTDTQINGKLAVRDSINDLLIEASPSASTFRLSAGNAILDVSKTTKLDQDISTVGSPTFVSLNLSGNKNQEVFNSTAVTGTLTWTPTGVAKVITLPDATTTLIGKDTTDTLTNKSLSGSDNTFTSIPNSALSNSKVTVSAGTNLSGGGDVNLGSSVTLSLADSISLAGTLTVSGTTTFNGVAYTWPSSDGSSGYSLVTNGSGTLSWSSSAGGWSKSGNVVYLATSSNNVGIGTSAPGSKLGIAGNVGIGVSFASSAVPSNGLALEGNLGIGTTSTSHNLEVIGTGNFSGNLGIGGSLTTSSLTYASGGLRVNGFSDLTGNVGIGSSLTVSSAGVFGSLQDNGSLNVSGTSYLSAINASSLTTSGNITSQGVFLAANGSASAPSYSFTNLTNAGLWTNGNGLLLTTGGSNTSGITVTGAGNVGIGLTTANSQLSISNNEHIGSLYQGTSAPTNGLFVDGNVGIGATTSSNKLDVWGNARITGSLTVDGNFTLGGTNTGAQFLAADGTASAPGYAFTNDTDSGLWRIGTNQIALTTGGAATSGLSINSSGNVGVGTTSATDEFEIKSNRTSGTILGLNFNAGTNLTGSLTGASYDLNDGNVTATNQDVTVLVAKLPTVTNTNSSGTVNLRGLYSSFGSGAGITQNGAGATVYSAAEFVLPALTQSSGTLTANGLLVDTPSQITTGGVANGLNISATGVGAGNLNGVNIGSITGQAGTETAVNIGTGWDTALKVGSTTVINGSGVTQVAGGGTGIASYSTGDILYASGATTLTNLGIGSSGQVLTTTAGVPVWSNISGSSCTTCLINNPSSTAVNTISPTGQATTGLTVRQTSTASPTGDIFDITNSTGSSKYFYVDSSGNVSTGAISNTTLTLTPTTDTTALTLVGTNVATSKLAYYNAANTQGTIFDISYGTPQMLTGTLTGEAINLGVGATNQSVTNLALTLPAPTNTGASTYNIKGLAVSGAGGLNNTGSGITNFYGVDVNSPAITQTSGTINSYGVNVSTPTSISTGGTAYGINVSASGISAGTLYGLNISGITAGAGSETGLAVGSGWDKAATFLGNVGIGTTSPGSKLDISQANQTLANIQTTLTSNNILIQSTYGAGTVYWPGLTWYTNDNNATKPKLGIWGYGDGSGSKLYFGTSNSYTTGITNSAMVIDPSGNLGVNTTTPQKTLDIGGTASTSSPGTAFLRLNNTHGNASDQFGILFTNYTNGQASGNYAGSAAVNANLAAGGATASLQFLTGGTTPSLAMTIDGSQNVGIGTAGPGNLLEVNKSQNGATAIYVDNAYTTAGNNAYSGLIFRQNGTNRLALVSLDDNNTSSTGGAGAVQIWNYVNAPILFATNGAEQIRITGAGNVGIGLTTANSQLSISNNVHIGSLYQGTSAPTNGLFVDGNVGIGATTSSNKLDVWGNARIAGTLTLDQALTVSGATTLSGSLTVNNSSLALNLGSDATGDIYYRNSGGTVSRLGIGSANQVLQVSGGLPSWVTSSSSSSQWTTIGSNIFYGGNVGVGNTVPNSTIFPYSRFQITGAGTGTGLSLLTTDSSGTQRFAILDNGNVGIGTTGPDNLLNVAGNAHVTGQIIVDTLGAAGATSLCQNGQAHISTCSSSGRYKENIQNLPDNLGLDAVLKMHPVTFNWKPQYNNGAASFGFIAEEMNKISPLFTFNNSQGQIEGVNYPNLTAVLARGIQQLDTMVSTIASQSAVFSKISLDPSGNIGIGTTAPQSALDVNGAVTAQTITTPTLDIGPYKVASSSSGLTVRNSSGQNILGLDSLGNLKVAGTITSNAGGFDVSEDYQTADNSIEAGNVVSASDSGSIVKSSAPYDQKMIGIISTKPGITLSDDSQFPTDSFGKPIKPMALALAGRVPTKVSTENGAIHIGDYLTSSSIPGVAMKASRPGPTVGKALEEYNDPDPKAVGKIMTFLNVSYADPGNFFASLSLDVDGNLIIPQIKARSIILDSSVASASAQLTATDTSVTVADAGIQSGMTQSVTYYDLTGKIASLENRIKNLESVIASGPSATRSNDNNATPSAQLAEATSSGEIATASASPRNDNMASLNLTPPDILLASSSAQLTDLSVKSDTNISGKLTAYQAQIQDNLKVLGQTTLSDTILAGHLTIDGTLAIENGSEINVIGTACHPELDSGSMKWIPDQVGNDSCGVLYLQKSPLASGLDIFDGKMTVDARGNIKTQGTLTAKEVVTDKLTVNSHPEFDSGPTTATSSAVLATSIGTATLPALSTHITIPTTAVTGSSKVFITPLTVTSKVLSVTDIVPGQSFDVSVADPTTTDIKFNWWIVQTQ